MTSRPSHRQEQRMAEQPIGPRCGNNPNVRLTPGDRKAIEDFKGRLALRALARPYIDSAAWVEGDPLMEVIAVTLWERCARDDEDMPQLVRDDPRTIAALAAAVARAHADTMLPSTADRAAETARVTAVYERWVAAGPPPIGTSMARWWDARLAELHAAIRSSQQQSEAEPQL